jgi:hypothetical protein
MHRRQAGSVPRALVSGACVLAVALGIVLVIDRIRNLPPPAPEVIYQGLLRNGEMPKDHVGPLAQQAAREGLSGEAWRNHKFAIGSPAPDFTLPTLDGMKKVHLADVRSQAPVVLLCGSFGCDLFCNHLGRLEELYQEHKDRATFLFIYVDEGPHKEILPWLPGEEKFGRVRRGLQHFGLSIPCLVADEPVQIAYKTFPARLLIIDRAGRIALDAGKPIGTDWDLNQLEAWLKQALVQHSSPGPGPSAPETIRDESCGCAAVLRSAP